ncbi:NAD(P)/FAD-dependent oxidoreductase [Salipiger mucosus]|uniref:Putative FAD dependent oxidoreductase n=1 Tax=Salipiger mucosus DSM 16094 TaxID=1123237 RepID=S9RUY6_9RHOB|nr:FAD-dependent oxidoreductase [Salipiger mucosus]EPX81860.1 putative FAD dependent oxidoreductase [Salipiger mucosus DSM 16094]
MVAETFDRSLWSAITPPGPDLPSLRGEVTADIVLVGAGYLGMTTALTLAAEGLTVALVEAREPGWGASGRNTGFVVPTLKKALSPANVRAAFGPRRGEAFSRMIGGSGTRLFELAREQGIEGAEQTGWLQPAHSGAAMAANAAQVAEWQALGFDVRQLGREDVAARTGMDGYHGAMLIPTGGQLNPLAYARGLARACQQAGVRLFAASPVTGIARDGLGWRVSTPGGSVSAPRAVLTTNALVGRLCPAVDRAVIPTRSFQIATQRFGAETQARVLPARSPVADTRRHLFAARWSPDGRIVGGGLVHPGPGRLARTRRRFEQRFARFLPQLGPVRADYAWTGTVAVTLDALPRLHRLGDGLWAPIACNGRGVALTGAFGHELGRFLAGRVTAEEFVVPVTTPEPVPLRALATLAPYAWLPWSEFRDRIEAERPS